MTIGSPNARNTDQFLGISAEALLGQRLEALIGKAQFELMIHRDLQAIATPDLQYINLTIPVGDDPVAFFGIVHESEGLILLELSWYRKIPYPLQMILKGYRRSSVA